MSIFLLSKPLVLPHESCPMMMTSKERLRLLEEMQTLFNKDGRGGDYFFFVNMNFICIITH
jgi:hypothetical protein